MQDFDAPESPTEKLSVSSQIRHDQALAKLIEQATLALGVDKSEFLRAAIEKEARRVLTLQTRHVLTEEDAKQFQHALDTAPRPTQRALDAARAYDQRVVYAE